MTKTLATRITCFLFSLMTISSAAQANLCSTVQSDTHYIRVRVGEKPARVYFSDCTTTPHGPECQPLGDTRGYLVTQLSAYVEYLSSIDGGIKTGAHPLTVSAIMGLVSSPIWLSGDWPLAVTMSLGAGGFAAMLRKSVPIQFKYQMLTAAFYSLWRGESECFFPKLVQRGRFATHSTEPSFDEQKTQLEDGLRALDRELYTSEIREFDPDAEAVDSEKSVASTSSTLPVRAMTAAAAH